MNPNNLRCPCHYRCDDCGIVDDLCHYHDGLLCNHCYQKRIDKIIAEFNGDTELTDNAICPHCGDENRESWELDSDHGIGVCENCGNSFEYNRIVTTEYTTKKESI